MKCNHPFIDADIEFEKTVEICKLWQTSVEDTFQIVAKDNVKNVLIILTWDFNKNIEFS